MMDRYLARYSYGLVLVFGAVAIFFAVPAYAQTAPSEPVPEPSPSVNDFSLTPGANQPTPQPAPAGPANDPPIQETAPPPVSNQPDSSQPQPRADTPAPTPRNAAPPSTVRQPIIRPDRPQPQASIRPPVQAPLPSAQVSDETADAEPAPQLDENNSTRTPIPDVPAEQNARPVSEPVSDQVLENEYLLPIGLVLATLLAGGAGLIFWRRKKANLSVDDNVDEIPLAQATPEKKPAPLIVSEKTHREEAIKTPAPRPIPASGPQPVNKADGFVTTKINKKPRARQPGPQPQPEKLNESHHLETAFTAKHASSTLMNAVVGYQIDIKNRAKGPIKNLKISGAMIQADSNVVESASSSEGLLLQELESLPIGNSETVSGEIRLPLGAFSPIEFQSQKLLVPLVLLRFDYLDQDGHAHTQTANYLIGAEHVPPREKMAPFRLDQGPRNFINVAHRPFQS